jgi:hypothetical protein
MPSGDGVFIGSGWEVCGWRYGHGWVVRSIDRSNSAGWERLLQLHLVIGRDSDKAQVLVRSVPSFNGFVCNSPLAWDVNATRVDPWLTLLAELKVVMSEGESDVGFIKDNWEGVLRGTDDGQTDKLCSKILGCSPYNQQSGGSANKTPMIELTQTRRRVRCSQGMHLTRLPSTMSLGRSRDSASCFTYMERSALMEMLVSTIMTTFVLGLMQTLRPMSSTKWARGRWPQQGLAEGR